MSNVIQNNAYYMRVMSDEGIVLHAQRTYLRRGVTAAGRPWYKDMRWFCYMINKIGQRKTFPGLDPYYTSKKQLVNAIRLHKSFTQIKPTDL